MAWYDIAPIAALTRVLERHTVLVRIHCDSPRLHRLERLKPGQNKSNSAQVGDVDGKQIPSPSSKGHAPAPSSRSRAPESSFWGQAPELSSSGRAPDPSYWGHAPEPSSSGHAPDALSETGNPQQRTVWLWRQVNVERILCIIE